MGAHGVLVLSWARISSKTSALARLPPSRACCAAALSSCMSIGNRSSADSCKADCRALSGETVCAGPVRR